MSFSVGDRVKRRPGMANDGYVATVTAVPYPGAIDGVYDGVETSGANAHFRLPEDWLEPHVDAFPIAADKDPWAKTEPPAAWNGYFGDLSSVCQVRHEDGQCCNRSKGHDGHHVSRRISTGEVHTRWPQKAKLAEKSGPAIDMPVVRTEAEPELCRVPAGTRGVVTQTNVDCFRVHFPGHGYVMFLPFRFGIAVIHAAEWDARQKRDTTPAPMCDLNGEDGGTYTPAAPITIRAQDATGVAEGKALVTCSPAAMARALFELDFDEHTIRVGDDGGGIGKAEVLNRMWDRLSDESRATYEWRAAIVLKRAVELA